MKSRATATVSPAVFARSSCEYQEVIIRALGLFYGHYGQPTDYSPATAGFM
jgi:hypothetical protein